MSKATLNISSKITEGSNQFCSVQTSYSGLNSLKETFVNKTVEPNTSSVLLEENGTPYVFLYVEADQECDIIINEDKIVQIKPLLIGTERKGFLVSSLLVNSLEVENKTDRNLKVSIIAHG
jgi:hypothetical protein